MRYKLVNHHSHKTTYGDADGYKTRAEAETDQDYYEGLTDLDIDIIEVDDVMSESIAIKWCGEDVYYTGKDKLKVDLTDAQIRDVLDSLVRYHDAEYGINWLTIEFAIKHVLDKEGEVELVWDCPNCGYEWDKPKRKWIEAGKCKLCKENK